MKVVFYYNLYKITFYYNLESSSLVTILRPNQRKNNELMNYYNSILDNGNSCVLMKLTDVS